MVSILTKAISLPSDYPYIVHHVDAYGNVPLWVAMNAITFGNVAKMFQYADTDIRAKVSQNYDKVSEAQLHQFIRIIANCRNVCAHSERLFTFHTKVFGPDTIIHKKLGITQKNGAYQMGKHDLFAIVIALRYLISDEDFNSFKQKLTSLILKANKGCPNLPESNLLEYMGFPPNWKRITSYKK